MLFSLQSATLAAVFEAALLGTLPCALYLYFAALLLLLWRLCQVL